jgi:hypothetical protein
VWPPGACRCGVALIDYDDSSPRVRSRLIGRLGPGRRSAGASDPKIEMQLAQSGEVVSESAIQEGGKRFAKI